MAATPRFPDEQVGQALSHSETSGLRNSDFRCKKRIQFGASPDQAQNPNPNPLLWIAHNVPLSFHGNLAEQWPSIGGEVHGPMSRRGSGPAANFRVGITSRSWCPQLARNTLQDDASVERKLVLWSAGRQPLSLREYPVFVSDMSFGALSYGGEKFFPGTRLRKKPENRHLLPGRKECCPRKQAEVQRVFL